MHAQAHMSGQISGQVPNQADSQLSGLPQLNGNSLPSQMPNLGGSCGVGNMDPDVTARKYMRDRLCHLFLQRPASLEMQARIPDVVKRLEECLFKTASSKDEYMNMDTLEHRLQALLRRPSSSNHNQQIIPSSSSIGTMIPTPGMSHGGSLNSSVTSMDNSMTAGNACNLMASNTVNRGNLSTAANGSASGHHHLLLKSDGFRESPSEHRTESHNEVLPSQALEQLHL